jgi:N-methylhydantoinase B/oxoprolinase/acetone carboxylase alpha subunit
MGTMEDFLQGFMHESDEARIEELFKSVRMYLDEMQDVRTRIASVHLLIRKLRDLSVRYQKMVE